MSPNSKQPARRRRTTPTPVSNASSESTTANATPTATTAAPVSSETAPTRSTEGQQKFSGAPSTSNGAAVPAAKSRRRGRRGRGHKTETAGQASGPLKTPADVTAVDKVDPKPAAAPAKKAKPPVRHAAAQKSGAASSKARKPVTASSPAASASAAASATTPNSGTLAPNGAKSVVAGVICVTPRGFGFVSAGDDAFVSPQLLRSLHLLDGDEVIAKIRTVDERSSVVAFKLSAAGPSSLGSLRSPVVRVGCGWIRGSRTARGS